MNTEDEQRYSRQTILPGFGAAGQARLRAARVLIVGCGGLGGPVAAYLAGAGIGHLTLVDGDLPHVSNLHRQVFFHTAAPGTKAEQLAQHCRSLNPGTCVSAQNVYLGPANVRALVSDADLVLDCTDDAATKHLLSDACALLATPLVYAAVQVFSGYVALFPNRGPEAIHLRDLFAAPDPTLPDCATTGVLPTAVGIVALLQTNAALCYLLGIGDPPVDALLTYDALTNQQHRLKIRKTYSAPLSPPWQDAPTPRESLETEEADFGAYDAVFSLLTSAQEPALPAGVIRLSHRDPLGQCRDKMQAGGRYLLYCQTGQRSLVLAAQLRRADPALDVRSLRGGRVLR
ncbi:HesA/MoeB/ThiF family protein [Neolewinella lacunae]|uniref:HesA/MoeB/ThiF family protein n=1 Tax=Neolewinella lacunae TaxID=1517758 RepID=A0A923PMH6_9BACT|nr:HesA/MoeB/ThiF family protein [Neolewinella lacunae]MBC6996179.1 HesA/MoeB/ThiF family protein [Neolewinella lacunae]MDN3635353.1 HesA/MoeB/ThiF family protein [Neolewinella lacunae]